jgi:regulatory protein
VPSGKLGSYQIIDISYTNNDVIITLENDKSLKIMLNAYLTTTPLVKGQFLDDKEIANLEILNERQKILEQAYNLLNKRMYSCSMLRKKLVQISSNNELVSQVIAMLIEKNYLNDAQYAYQYASDYYDMGKGWNYIYQKLSQDGISEEVLSLTRDKFPKDLEEKSAKQLAKKMIKKPSKKSHQQQLAQVYNGLISKGFNVDTVEQIVGEYKYYDQDVEIKNAKAELVKIKKRLSKITDKRELYVKIYSALMNKGYKSATIKAILKEGDNDD